MENKTLEICCNILAERVIQLEEELRYQKLLNSMLEEKLEKVTEEK
jgi:hypothetical protein